MNTLSDLKKIAQETYDRIWNDWYSTKPGHTQATLEVNTACTHSGYSHSRNLIVVSVGKGNLEDFDITAGPDLFDQARWPIWMPNLVHEMLHEYERKVIVSATAEGLALHRAHPHPWWGEGHEGPFYSAIASQAGHFRLTPRELLEAI